MGYMIERQRSIIDFTLSSLWRRKWKISSLVLVYTLVVFVLASVLFFTHALQKEAAQILKGAPEIIVQRTRLGRYEQIPATYAARIRTISGVMAVRERLWGYYYDPAFKANYTMVVPEHFPYEPGTIAIGAGISRMRRAYAGDTVSFTGFDGGVHNYTVQEVLAPESELVSADLVLISDSDYRALSGIGQGFATDLALTVRNPREQTTIAGKIAQMLPDSRPIIRNEMLRTYDAVFNWRGGIVVVILSGAMLAFAIFAWDKATGLSAEERKEIGILKAVGWETSDILLMKFWEGITVSLFAFLAGIALAYLHTFIGAAALFLPVLKGWSVLYPEFRLVPNLDASQILTLLFLTVVPYTVTTIIPSWRAATIDPDLVLR